MKARINYRDRASRDAYRQKRLRDTFGGADTAEIGREVVLRSRYRTIATALGVGEVQMNDGLVRFALLSLRRCLKQS